MRNILLGLAAAACSIVALMAQGDPKPTCTMCPGTYIPKAELHNLISKHLRVPQSHIITEYGMSELNSQAYDGLVLSAAIEKIATVPTHDISRAAIIAIAIPLPHAACHVRRAGGSGPRSLASEQQQGDQIGGPEQPGRYRYREIVDRPPILAQTGVFAQMPGGVGGRGEAVETEREKPRPPAVRRHGCS